MDDHLPVTLPVRSADIAGRRPRSFDLTPAQDQRAGIAALLDLLALESLRFQGELRPDGRRDVVLEGRLLARAVQACVVSLAPVTTEIAVTVIRRYVAGLDLPTETEIEMPEDDTTEPLPEVIDAGAVMIEALALALPDYPRAPGSELGSADFAPPGAEPLRDEALRPFAGLAALRDRLAGAAAAQGDPDRDPAPADAPDPAPVITPEATPATPPKRRD